MKNNHSTLSFVVFFTISASVSLHAQDTPKKTTVDHRSETSKTENVPTAKQEQQSIITKKTTAVANKPSEDPVIDKTQMKEKTVHQTNRSKTTTLEKK